MSFFSDERKGDIIARMSGDVNEIENTVDEPDVEKPSDLVKVGDIIQVKSMGYDKRGRLNLSRKEVLKDMEEAK